MGYVFGECTFAEGGLYIYGGILARFYGISTQLKDNRVEDIISKTCQKNGGMVSGW